MFQIKSTDSISSLVNGVIKSHIDTKGEAWLLGLGYGPCNDYADSIARELTQTTGYYVRFETVARYIRANKAAIRAKNKQA